MTLSPILDAFPIDVQIQIFSLVTPSDLTKIARTSKRLNKIATPLLWNDIEFHQRGYHESKHEIKAPPPMRDPERRPYHTKQQYTGSSDKAGQFFMSLLMMRKEDPDRLEHITKRVRHLCTAIDHSQELAFQHGDLWDLLPYFSNLETLELHGEYDHWQKYDGKSLDSTVPLLRLRFLKLSGYVPRVVPAWLLKSGETLERLELDMLDRPISSNNSTDREFAPLPHEKVGNRGGDGESDEESDYGSLDAEIVIPRPLGGYLTSYGLGELKLPKLRHLYLGQPAPSRYSDWMDDDYSWSTRAEAACYDDWFEILSASIGTLDTLVLEQMPAAEYIENDGYPEHEWMTGHLSSSECETLLDMVETIMATHNTPLSLKRVYVYGMAVRAEDDGTPSVGIPTGRFMHFLKGCGVECEARLGQWCFFGRDQGSVALHSWDAASDFEAEEEEDEELEPGERWDGVLLKV